MPENGNKIVTFDRIIILLILIILGYLLFFQKSKMNETTVFSKAEKIDASSNKIICFPLPDTLFFAGEQVPLELFYVKESLDQELIVNAYWHSATLQLIKRSNRWLPMIDSILKKNNIPGDFKYVCAIESGLTNAVSPAGATGFWQFLKDTGIEYGLEINDEVDERYNVSRSTEAACRYLHKAYDKYKNWTLVAASYNAGMNGISKMLDEQNASTYYDLLTSQETSRYVFRALAVKLILSNPQYYGFSLQSDELYKPIPVHYIKVNERVNSWTDFAKEHGITYKLLKYFNPWLREKSLKNRKGKVYWIAIPDSPFNLTHQSLKN